MGLLMGLKHQTRSRPDPDPLRFRPNLDPMGPKIWIQTLQKWVGSNGSGSGRVLDPLPSLFLPMKQKREKKKIHILHGMYCIAWLLQFLEKKIPEQIRTNCYFLRP